MTEKLRILIVEDDPSLGKVLLHYLKRQGHKPTLCPTASKARDENIVSFDAVLLDLRLDDENGFDLMRTWQTDVPSLPPIIVMTGENTPGNAIEAMGGGAHDYLVKPFDLDALNAILAPLERIAVDEEVDVAPQVATNEAPRLVGRHPAMQEIYKKIGLYSRHDGTVLIEGENGVGKELVARAIHASSARAGGPFIAINMSAIPDTLLESELFGHDRGAFTGADKSKLGKFRQANGGTLFLDEIGDMPLAVQAKLLRVLQEREVTPVGSAQSYAIDVRVVAATQVDMKAAVEDDRFRQDLYFRLNVLPLMVPPLRSRLSDIKELVQVFARASGNSKQFSDAAIELLRSHNWPGNVRELQNVVQRVTLLTNSTIVDVEDVVRYADLELDTGAASTGTQYAENAGAIDTWLGPIIDELVDAEASDVMRVVLEPFERKLITQAMERFNANQIRVAEFLGVNRNTLRKRISLLNIDVNEIKAKVRAKNEATS